MNLIQLLLPLCNREGRPLPRDEFEAVAQELTQRFGGMTSYARAPARGLWEGGSGGTERDDLVVYEVMAAVVDEPWWAAYRRSLEARFDQEELVIRCLPLKRL